MIRNLLVVGVAGSGKDSSCEVLEEAYPRTRIVSMSELLNGGTSNGALMEDGIANAKLFSHLESIGFHNKRRSYEKLILQGVGRTGFQMQELLQYLEKFGELPKTAVCKFNIRTSTAMSRMWDRYQKNLKTGKFRKEESRDEVATRENFRKRLCGWISERDQVFKVIDKWAVLGLKVININAEQALSLVIHDLVSGAGWDTRPAMAEFLGKTISENHVPGTESTDGFKGEGSVRRPRKNRIVPSVVSAP